MILDAIRCDDALARRSLDVARGIADWLCAVQTPIGDDAGAGSFPFTVHAGGREGRCAQWNLAFASMGLLAASRTFGEPRYEAAALRMARYLKTLQIVNAFHPDHYGAIREKTPQMPWGYTRDMCSGAWGFLELHRHTGEAEYLERARLWAAWLLRCGLDEEGYPLWGVQLEPYLPGEEPQMCNHIQGSFQGGGLAFLYHLALETKDPRWVGRVFVNIADRFIEYVQQPSGFFASVERATHRPPEADPQGGLHRANDDLGTLGLLAAYRATADPRYISGIERFLRAVFAAQREDGGFEESVACIPVALNIVKEADGTADLSFIDPDACRRALERLLAAPSDGARNPRMKGGLLEVAVPRDAPTAGTDPYVCARSSCYALIVLQKLFSPALAGTSLLAAPEMPASL